MKSYIIKFARLCREADTIFHEKNEIYANNFELVGVKGTVYEIVGIAGKLVTMVIRSPFMRHRAAIRDALIDLHNFANIGLLMLDEDNWDGTLLR